MEINPLLIEDNRPSMESMEKFLEPRQFQRFDKVYKELLGLGFNANLEWNKNDRTWFYRYYRNGFQLFDLRLGNDHFNAELNLTSDDYLKITRAPELTELALNLLRNYPENRTRKSVFVEAELNKMSEQEGFFDLLPVLTKALLG